MNPKKRVPTSEEQMKERFDKLFERYKKLAAENQAHKEPPRGIMYFVRFLRMEKVSVEGLPDAENVFPLVEVMDRDGKRAEVFIIDLSINPQGIRYGQKVVVAGGCEPNHIISVKVDEFETVGTEAFIETLLEKDHEALRAVVLTGETDKKEIVHIAESVSSKELEAGTRVTIDPRTQLILNVLPEAESQQFLLPEIPKETFSDIGGLDREIEELTQKLLWPMLYPEAYRAIRREMPKGYVLAGPPGVGKTLLAQALIHEASTMIAQTTGQKSAGYFFHIAGPELERWLVGRTSHLIRMLFERAKKLATPLTPVIIFFDEMESLFQTRGSGISQDTEKQNVAQLTTLLDGLEDRSNIIVIGASNRSDTIDPAVIRPGRFDGVISLPRPDENGVKAIFTKHLHAAWGEINPKYDVEVHTDESGKKHRFNKDLEKVLEYLVERAAKQIFRSNRILRVRYEGDAEPTEFRSHDFISGAMVKNIVLRAKDISIREHVKGQKPLGVTLEHLNQAIEEEFLDLYTRHAAHGNPRAWLAIEGKLPKPIVNFRFASLASDQDEEEL